MKLIVGLGNPGQEYVDTRHNIGFNVVDQLHYQFNFPAWREGRKGLYSMKSINGENIMLLKPQTYMNSSGECVVLFKQFYKLDNKDIIVIYDEMALSLGRLKIKSGGSHAGHNGIKSMDLHVNPGYMKFRVGIDHPGSRELVRNHVMGRFTDEQLECVDEFCRFFADNFEEDVIRETFDNLMSKNALRNAQDK